MWAKFPFHDVFIHPKILDGYGRGHVEIEGNGVDPLDVMEKFGADSLRFSLAYLTTETQDIRMPVEFECPHCSGLIRADEGEPHPPAAEVQTLREGVFPRQMGPKSRRTRPCRAERWSATASSWRGISATSFGTPRGSR